jgi:hypothetical protein
MHYIIFLIESFSHFCDFKKAILHREINILLADLEYPECSNPAVPGASHSWSVRKELSQDRWRASRPEMDASQKICQSCNVKRAILRCRDCLPEQLYCEDCDVSTHAKFPLRNRQSMLEGFYTPLPPTTYISLHSFPQGRYNVTVPVLTCTTCLCTWTANLADLIKNGHWPTTVNCDTIYQLTCSALLRS